ncbi:unnamed protein product [Paramecium pentaurelia]|uniref:Uncharacterized protein n=1 Tax=Paramecium pentaurelia TaxID=43138 RepID=A0A8S1V1I2_9CILI|nr:unnamed protein product [Paramecium pentaurelia]
MQYTDNQQSSYQFYKNRCKHQMKMECLRITPHCFLV